jgi:hypothetical protein
MSSHTRGTEPTELDAQNGTTPKTEPYPTPLVSAADVDRTQLATRTIPCSQADGLKLATRKIASGWAGDTRDHYVGLLGEDALAQFFGVPEGLNTEVYADGGDGDVDLRVNGATIDVKTAR